MIWIFFILLALLLVGGLAAVLTGRATPDPMADPVASTPHHGLPPGDLRAADLDAVRFDTALRGYRMDQVDDVLDRVRKQIADLESEVASAPTPQPPDGDPDHR